jgi:hypothetical protein
MKIDLISLGPWAPWAPNIALPALLQTIMGNKLFDQ